MCKKYSLDEFGDPLEDVTGAKIKIENHTCSGCEKEGFQDGWDEGNAGIFKCYMLASKFGIMPRAGGLDQQSSEVIDGFYLLTLTERGVVQNTEKQKLGMILPILGMGKSNG